MFAQKTSCSHPGCRCELETRYVSFGDRDYCSGNCADGVGCDHEDCNCGRVRSHPPGFASFVQGAVRHLHGKQ